MAHDRTRGSVFGDTRQRSAKRLSRSASPGPVDAGQPRPHLNIVRRGPAVRVHLSSMLLTDEYGFHRTLCSEIATHAAILTG